MYRKRKTSPVSEASRLDSCHRCAIRSHNMVYNLLRFPVFAVLVVVLTYNMTQRRHLEHGERKRFASLKFAGLILLFAVELYLIQWFALPSPLAYLAFAVVIIAAVLMRSGFTIYKVKCVNCTTPLSLTRVLYYDDSLCPACEESLSTLESAGDKSTQFPNGVPRLANEVDWEAWVPDETAVLCFIRNDNDVMLIRKKTGLGAGKINAPGGRIEPGESAETAAIRETIEETEVTPTELECRVYLSFIFTNGYSLYVTVFFASAFSGTPMETREAAPFWCDITNLPFEKMWEDDREWLPRAITGELLDARFIFDGEQMISKHIKSIDPFENRPE